jgi:fructose-1,6-bisphosphatase II / sedoheptulose-1,7-bisphosphatase
LLNGVRRSSNFIETDTMLMRSRTGSVRRLNYRQKINR